MEQPDPSAADPSAADQSEPPPPREISPARINLISAYAAINAKLKDELARIDPDLPLDVDPRSALLRAANQWDQPGWPPVHRLQLAFATMAVLGREPAPPDMTFTDLHPVSRILVDPDQVDLPDVPDRVLAATRRAGAARVDDRVRWQQLLSEVGDRLHPELRKIRTAWCTSGLRAFGGEIVSRVETRLVVESAKDLDSLALALLPDNWSHCNDFFCSLTRRDDRDAGCSPPTTGGNLATSATNWRGVYEERVGRCPYGWFPDTYLIFTWNRSDRQIILRYELAPRRPTDRTVLRIDRGYIQVDRVGPTYDVSTVKYLLFDDQSVPNGGQTLGQSACQLGWLDYSVNQFTDCADKMAGGSVAGAAEPSTDGDGARPYGFDAELQDVLNRCAGNIVESVSETNAQLDRIASRIRAGPYGLDDSVADVGRLALRAIRDGARAARGHTELATRYADLVRTLARRGEDGE